MHRLFRILLAPTMALTFATSLASCATFGRPSAQTPVTPPRRELPATARAACQIPPLPSELSGPIEVAFPAAKLLIAAAAAEILRCDVSRQLGVDTHDGEHADEDAWLKEAAGRPLSIGSIAGGG
jgi:hypothetical protein